MIEEIHDVRWYYISFARQLSSWKYKENHVKKNHEQLSDSKSENQIRIFRNN